MQQVGIADPKVFGNVMYRIQRILRHNYLDAFYQERRAELLSIPTSNHKLHLPKREFNAIGQDATPIPGQSPSFTNSNKACNIFEIMLTRRTGLNSTAASSKFAASSSGVSIKNEADNLTKLTMIKKIS